MHDKCPRPWTGDQADVSEDPLLHSRQDPGNGGRNRSTMVPGFARVKGNLMNRHEAALRPGITCPSVSLSPALPAGCMRSLEVALGSNLVECILLAPYE
jgi:hypothetical protein